MKKQINGQLPLLKVEAGIDATEEKDLSSLTRGKKLVRTDIKSNQTDKRTTSRGQNWWRLSETEKRIGLNGVRSVKEILRKSESSNPENQETFAQAS